MSEQSEYMVGKYAEQVEVSIGCIRHTCAKNNRTDVEIAHHYHMKYGFEVIRIGEQLYKFNDGREVVEVPRIRSKVPPLSEPVTCDMYTGRRN